MFGEEGIAWFKAKESMSSIVKTMAAGVAGRPSKAQ
jgi:hypothetical protein